MPKHMLDFQRYQIAFTAHIRSPKTNKKPAKVIDARMGIYREIVFNTIFSSVSACFPVCQSMLGTQAWHKLVRAFFANHQAATPIFREIPQQFLLFIGSRLGLPIYFQSLAHYEWVELAVASQQMAPVKLSDKIDLLNEKPILAQSHMLLNYDFAVQNISKGKHPTLKVQTYLLVFRNTENNVKFIELNHMTFQLLSLIKCDQLTGKQALMRLADELNVADVNAITMFGAEILADLASQQAIIGIVTLYKCSG